MNTLQKEETAPRKFHAMGPSPYFPRLSSTFHCIAGFLLLLFGLSHFEFLRITGYEGTLPNLVFTFVSNNNLYLTAGILESATAMVCLTFRGQIATDFVILSFVAMLLLYRWAFYFLGGLHCNCLGTLGALLHTSKKTERMLANLSLLILILTTLPGLYTIMRRILVRIRGKIKLFGLMILFIIAQTRGTEAAPVEGLEIYGSYNATAQNPITGEPRIADYRHVDATFKVVTCGNQWLITATNLNDINDHSIEFVVPKDSVGQIWCDGTNTYCLQPGVDRETGQLTNLVTVTPGLYYNGSYDPDFLGMSLPWLTYCLNPRTVHREATGDITLPVPWLQPRFSPFAYGYKWIIATNRDSSFMAGLILMRDTNLDLSDEASLRRPGFDYPHSLADYENKLRRLNAFRFVPTGWIESKYKCTGWLETNGISIPANSEITGFYYNPQIKNPFPSYSGKLRLTRVSFEKTDENALLPGVIRPTRVSDFRYSRTNLTRIYWGAQYNLEPGDGWKPADDKILLAQAEDYLKHGRRYDFFLHRSNVYVILVWLLFGVVFCMPILVALYSKSKQNKRNDKL